MIPIPKIALVGRPNVGKSTLFNRICGRRKAITDSRPGSTRDRNYAQTSWQGAAFELIDTGGLLLGTDDPLLGPAADQADLAIDEADLVIFVVDGRAGLLPDDRAIAKQPAEEGQARAGRGEQDREATRTASTSSRRSGSTQVHAISAEHGLGVGDLLDAALAEGLPKVEVPEDEEKPPSSIALVGRPNVGKSSLLNRFLGEERAVVSPIPGTTRDAVDSLLVRGRPALPVRGHGGHPQVAPPEGERRPRQRRAVAPRDRPRRRGAAGPRRGRGDARDGRHHRRLRPRGRPRDRGGREQVGPARTSGKTKEMETRVRDKLKFLAYAPIVFTSAKTGAGLASVLKTAPRVYRRPASASRPGPLNRMLAEAAARHAAQGREGEQRRSASSSPPRSGLNRRRSCSRSTTRWTCTSPTSATSRTSCGSPSGSRGRRSSCKVRTRDGTRDRRFPLDIDRGELIQCLKSQA